MYTFESLRAKITELERYLAPYDVITALDRLKTSITDPTPEMIELIEAKLREIRGSS